MRKVSQNVLSVSSCPNSYCDALHRCDHSSDDLGSSALKTSYYSYQSDRRRVQAPGP